jgi:CHASE2 domain-containing sensor protein
MSKEVIQVHGEDVVVRDDTAKAFRWRQFAVIIFAGIILIFIVWMVFFSGFLKLVDRLAARATRRMRPEIPGRENFRFDFDNLGLC